MELVLLSPKYESTITCVPEDRFPQEGSRYMFDFSCS